MTNSEFNSGFVIFTLLHIKPDIYLKMLLGFAFYFILILNKDSLYENFNQPNQIKPYFITTR